MTRILCCDDEPHIVEGVRFLLRAPDRELVVAHSGQQAIDSILETTPDLLIVDIMMPGMSGLEVISTLRANPKYQALPIIILTAKGQAQDAAMAQEVWGAVVVAKPFQPQKLRELVTSTLEIASCHQPS